MDTENLKLMEDGKKQQANNPFCLAEKSMEDRPTFLVSAGPSQTWPCCEKLSQHKTQKKRFSFCQYIHSTALGILCPDKVPAY